MGQQLLPPSELEAIDIAVDDRYMGNCIIRGQHQNPDSITQSSFFSFPLLPAELRIMVIDTLVSSALSAAAASRSCIKTSPRTFLSKHEAWLVALETVRNLVACSLDFAAQVLDSLVRVRSQPHQTKYTKSTLGKGDKRESEDEDGDGHALDDALSELLYEVRAEICRAHGREVLQTEKGKLAEWVRRRPRGLGRDLWRLAPGPEEDAEAREAWKRLYGVGMAVDVS